MNLKTTFTSSFFLKRVFLGSLFILIFISGVTYRHTIALSKSTDAVVHSHKVNLVLEQILSYIKDAETAQRGYIISKNPIFLQPYNGSRRRVNNCFTMLRQLTIDNLRQQNNLDTLNKMIDLRYSLLMITIDIHTQKSTDRESLDKSFLEGKISMDNIRSKIDEMIKLEMTYLHERQSTYNSEISFTPIFTLSLFLFTVLIFVISYVMINRNLKNVMKANEILVITTESINHAEIIGNFCTTQWNLTTKKLIYSDNLYRLLGCEPHSFVPTIENYVAFVHPEDRHIMLNGTNDIFKKGQTYVRSYRIIRKDGEQRFFKSIGKMIESNKNSITHIGVISDVTEQYLSNAELEDRNRELERMNNELASFNYVASHDLQEPLRKIQLFISRIEDSEKRTLTEIGKEYFSRIHVSALRMRTLIDDLLMFSRANKIDKVSQKTNLNHVLERVKSELVEGINEKNAVIEFTSLPVLNVIPYQIQQLFINLISNSLKYSKTEVKSQIRIECEKVKAEDYKIITKTNGKKKYFKFTFTDNGIGFEQSQAENIFILFNRLHHKAAYSGTGIGLAICKKIVENHNGFITAKGIPGVGATFIFFLPE